ISSLNRRTKGDSISLMKKSSPLKRKSIMTVSEFRSRFGDEVLCGEHLTAQRWPDGFVCPRCGGRSRGYMASRRVHECAGCGYQSSVTSGTIVHKTRTPLTSWFWAIYRMSQDKKGISALQLSKEIGGSYPTARLMQHKIRKAMADRDQALQSIALIAVRHGLANLMLHQPSCGIRDADLLAQLQCGNPFLVLAHAVDRPEPAREGSSSLVKNGTGGRRRRIHAPADWPCILDCGRCSADKQNRSANAEPSGALHTGPRRQSGSGIRSPS